MMPTLSPAVASRPVRTGATGTALEGSITILNRSQTKRSASSISAAVAVTSALTRRRGGPRGGRERRRAGDDPGAIALGRRPLDRRGGPGHDDTHGDAEQLPGQGKRLRVVARRVGDHPRRASLLAQLQQGVHRPPELERPDALEVLALQQDCATAPSVQGPRLEDGGPVDPWPESLRRLADLVNPDCGRGTLECERHDRTPSFRFQGSG